MIKLVLLRHGKSIWNQENRFTGWTDIDLSEKGIEEAQRAGRLLRKEGYTFDYAVTSVLKRAIRSLWIVLDELDLMWIPFSCTWRLNERHYGSLQGCDKRETMEKYGEEQFQAWRRGYDTPIPPSSDKELEKLKTDPRYLHLTNLPKSETLKNTLGRVLPYWEREIVPNLRQGKKIIIVAHGNSLRALVKHLDTINDKEIVSLNIPTGIPLVYELDDDMRPCNHYFLEESKD